MVFGKVAASLPHCWALAGKCGWCEARDIYRARVRLLKKRMNKDPAPRFLGFALWLPHPETGFDFSWWVGTCILVAFLNVLGWILRL